MTTPLFHSISVDEAYSKLDDLPPQTYVQMGPGLSMKRKANGVPVMRIHYEAIPERNRALNPVWSAPLADRGKYDMSFPEWQQKNERRKYSTRGWDREQEINDLAGGGDKLFASVLATFGQMIIITDPMWYPKPWWDCVGGFDHGKTNATCLEKAYIDENGDIYMCGEFYQMKTETFANNIWQNVPTILSMPDLMRMRWIRADPSIFYDKEAQLDGSFTNINAVYRKQGFTRLTTFPTEVSREDLTFEERLNDHWANLGEPMTTIEGEVISGGRKPSLYIVCRNELDRRQPGLHPYDCPNLLWELRRMQRQELSSRQLLVRNPTEKIIDKNNHAWDAFKYLVLSLPKPTAIPLEHKLAALVAGLNPMSANIAATRFLNMSGGTAGGGSVNKRLDLRSRKRMSR